MNTFRFTARTQCGKTNIVVEEAQTLEAAKAKYKLHVAMKHSPMKLLKTEVKTGSNGLFDWTTM